MISFDKLDIWNTTCSIDACALSFLVAMETKKFFLSIYHSENINILIDIIREHCSKLNLLQLSHSMFCKNIASLAVAREHHLLVAMCDAP